MTFERRNQFVREQYNTLTSCLKCEGNKGCDRYLIPEKSTNLVCVWYRTILNDLEKLKTGDGCLTFPLLEKILEDQKDLEELPAHKKDLYVQGCNYMKT